MVINHCYQNNPDTKSPPLFLAEIGTFFSQDIGLAKNLIDQIHDASILVPQQPLMCKLEILDNHEICLDGDYCEQYQNKAGLVKKENYKELIKRKTIELSYYEQLFAHLKDINLPFAVSVYETRTADFAKKSGASMLKIASGNIVHIPLIRHVARLGLPMIIDTGRASLSEVYQAYETAKSAGCEHIIIEHSPDGHPAQPQAHNLRILQTYKQCFNVPVGLSDHYNGNEMLYMAIALGASILEKGVFHDSDALDQDISHSLSMSELPLVLKNIYFCWQAMGSAIRDSNAAISGTIGSSYRNCLVTNTLLKKGDELSLDKVRFAFPCIGIPVQNWDIVVGRKINKTIESGQPILWDDVFGASS